LAPWAAVFVSIACLGCGMSVLWTAGGKPALRSSLSAVLVIGLAVSAAQYLVVRQGLFSIGSMIAALLGLAMAVAWSRRRGGKPAQATAQVCVAVPDESKNGSRGVAHPQPAIPLGWALFPYGLLVAVILLANLSSKAGKFLGQVVIKVQFPELVTARGWTTPAGAGRSIDVFGHAGALLLYAAFASFLLLRRRGYYRPGAEAQIARGVVKGAVRPSLGIAAMVGMAAAMEHAGMTYLIAESVAQAAGPAFPLVSPFVGALGAFMTGSNTNSNVVFASLQQQVALMIHASPSIILAAQTVGAAIGSLFAPAKVIVACSTVNLHGKEGMVLGTIMRYSVLILCALGLAAAIAIRIWGH